MGAHKKLKAQGFYTRKIYFNCRIFIKTSATVSKPPSLLIHQNDSLGRCDSTWNTDSYNGCKWVVQLLMPIDETFIWHEWIHV